MARTVMTMARMRSLGLTGLCLAVLAGAGGCVSQQEYDNLADANLATSSRLEELRRENNGLQLEIEERQGRIGDLESQIGGLESTRNSMRDQIEAVRKQYTEFQSRLNSISLSGLDPETDRRLRDLAASDPDLMTYDPNKGVIRFTSDLTFASGSDVVRNSAKGALSTLASVLLESEASGYDIQVVGHTDSQPISRSKSQHATNRHLSAHRAIAVSESLQKAGMSAGRVLVAGWGQFDPIAANNTSGGTAANRRVEVFLMPAGSFRTGNGSRNAGTPTSTKQTAPAPKSNSNSDRMPPPIVK